MDAYFEGVFVLGVDVLEGGWRRRGGERGRGRGEFEVIWDWRPEGVDLE